MSAVQDESVSHPNGSPIKNPLQLFNTIVLWCLRDFRGPFNYVCLWENATLDSCSFSVVWFLCLPRIGWIDSLIYSNTDHLCCLRTMPLYGQRLSLSSFPTQTQTVFSYLRVRKVAALHSLSELDLNYQFVSLFWLWVKKNGYDKIFKVANTFSVSFFDKSVRVSWYDCIVAGPKLVQAR